MRIISIFFFLLFCLGACSSSPLPTQDGGDFDSISDVDVLQIEWGSEDFLITDSDTVLPGDAQCGGGKTLNLKAGKVTIQGTTKDSTNQYGKGINCGGAIPFEGPQTYFQVQLVSDNGYRFTLKPGFNAVMYLVSSCGINAINSDCSSGGSAGILSEPILAGQTGKIVFIPQLSGIHYLVVDSETLSEAGTFTLTAEEFGQPVNGICQGATSKTLVNGKAHIKGTTLGARNQFGNNISCGLGVTFDGPQVFYSVDLLQDTWYRITLSSDFWASLYLFNSEGKCLQDNVDLDCSTQGGTVIPSIEAGSPQSTAFLPATSGTYIVAVDSLSAFSAGDFILDIESFDPPNNMICNAANTITLNNGSGSVSSGTTGFINDTGAQLYCGFSPRLIGPQAYYQVSLEAKEYTFTLSPEFDAFLVLGQTCLSLSADCASGGLSGNYLYVPAYTTGNMTFSPSGESTYVLVVDGETVGGTGDFDLTVEESVSPTNGVCSTPQNIVLDALGQAIITDNTGLLKNDLLGVNCGHANGPWPGPQAYYKLSLVAGNKANIKLIPDSNFDAALYAFNANTVCYASSVNTACSSFVSDAKGPGLSETININTSIAAEYVIVVDSWSPSEVGTFTLEVSVGN